MDREDNKVDRETRKQLAEFELELIERIRQTVKDGKTPDAGLVMLLGKISDLKLVENYVHKFGEAIQKNPSLMLPPGVMPGSLAQKLRGLQVSVERQNKRDGRRSSTPPRDVPDRFELPNLP